MNYESWMSQGGYESGQRAAGLASETQRLEMSDCLRLILCGISAVLPGLLVALIGDTTGVASGWLRFVMFSSPVIALMFFGSAYVSFRGGARWTMKR